MVETSHTIGVRAGAKGESSVTLENGRVITDSMAEKQAKGNSPKKKIKQTIKAEFREVEQPPSVNNEVQKIDPQKLLKDLLPSGFNAIVSEKLESGKAWHFPYSNTYMVNKEDWNLFLSQVIVLINNAQNSDSLELNTIKPSDDPALGPLMGLMGDIFST